jgi:hypothetical protein
MGARRPDLPDPHVVALHYRFESIREYDKFGRAQPLEGSLGRFDYSLANGELVARPQDHFADRESARDALEPLLRSWEGRAFLSDLDHRISFRYNHTDIVDRDPIPGQVVAYAEIAIGSAIAGDATIIRDNSAYPPPDPGFVTTPITERLAERVRRVRDSEAELPATAYYVLTELENEFGGGGGRSRRTAADRLGVDSDLLNKLGELTGRYDPDIGRKAKGPPAPLTDAEVKWIRGAMLRLVVRTGELAGGTSPPRITMNDLPPL